MRCTRCGIEAQRGQTIFNVQNGQHEPWCDGCANTLPRPAPLGGA